MCKDEYITLHLAFSFFFWLKSRVIFFIFCYIYLFLFNVFLNVTMFSSILYYFLQVYSCYIRYKDFRQKFVFFIFFITILFINIPATKFKKIFNFTCCFFNGVAGLIYVFKFCRYVCSVYSSKLILKNICI